MLTVDHSCLFTLLFLFILIGTTGCCIVRSCDYVTRGLMSDPDVFPSSG